MADRPQEVKITVDGATQDEALAKAREEAKKQGYKKVSLKNTVAIKYTAVLYDPIILEKEEGKE